MSRVVNPRFFNQPGFDELYGAWSAVFERNETGNYVMSSKDALAMLAKAHSQVVEVEGLSKSDAFSLESVACRYAQEIPQQFEEDILNA